MSVHPVLGAARVAAVVLVLAGCSATQGAPSVVPSVEPDRSAPASVAFAVTPAGAFSESLVEGLRTEVDVPFAAVQCGAGECAVPLDVLAPTAGTALPTFVLVPGGPVEFEMRRYMELLAAELARQGAVVVLTTYRSSVTGNTESDSLLDVRCAVRYARSLSAEFGGDPQRVVLAGHSLGSNYALQTGVDPEVDTPGCLVQGDGVPEAVVGLSEFAFSLESAAGVGPRFLLLGGEDDPYSEGGEAVAQELRDAGFEAEYREFAGTDHGEMVDPEATPAVIEALFEAASWTAP